MLLSYIAEDDLDINEWMSKERKSEGIDLKFGQVETAAGTDYIFIWAND